jgi:hypothetical protein
MDKKTKIILGIIITVLVGIAFIAVVIQNSRQSNTPGGEKALPGYLLPPQEEMVVKEVVKSFVSLYNTYSTYNYTNPQSLGDLTTVEFQEKLLLYIQNLEEKTPEGYSIRTNAKDSTFSFSYPEQGRLYATISAEVKETRTASVRDFPETETYTVTAKITFVNVQGSWLVDDILITKN